MKVSSVKIIAIVVAYNGKKWLDKCFSSLKQSSIPINIIAIDNASTDGTPEVIREKFPEVSLVQSDKNLGFGQANNIGLRKALDEGADYVFLLNQDAWVDIDAIEKLINAHQHYPEYGIISPLHLNGAGTGFDYGFLNHLCRNKDRKFLNELYTKTKTERHFVYPLDFVNAAFWLIPRSTIEKAGGFNPLFFHYGEDREYVNRCNYFGLKIGFVPSAVGYHDRLQQDSDSKKTSLKKYLLLIKALDPNQSYSWLNACSNALKSSMLSLLSGDFKNAIDYFKVASSFLKNCRKITHSKELIKNQGSNYLTK